MIESCTVQRMILGIIFLGGLTILVLVIESNWTSSNNNRNLPRNTEHNSSDTCWLNEDYEIVEECHPCSDIYNFERCVKQNKSNCPFFTITSDIVEMLNTKGILSSCLNSLNAASDFEIASKTNKVCAGTHYKEAVHCKQSGKVYRSCDKVKWLEEKKFWQFEGIMLLLACISTAAVHLRQKVLDHRMLRRIQRQIANSVMMGDPEVFILIFRVDGDKVIVPVHSALCLFLLKYLQHPPQVSVTFVLSSNEECQQPALSLNLKGFNFRIVELEDLESPIKDCNFPVFAINDGISCVAGLCAVLRQIIKSSGEENRWLLGFREGCLSACAEVSLWTRFCEIDVILSVENIIDCQIDEYQNERIIEIPKDIVRFEEHLNQAVRVHNIKKVLQSTNQEALAHSFAESHEMSLADVMIFACFYIMFNIIENNDLESSVPLVYKWYNLVSNQSHVLESVDIFNIPKRSRSSDFMLIKPSVPAQSLYKSDPKRYKPRAKLFTRQDDIEGILAAIDNVDIPVEFSMLPFGNEETLNWATMPNRVQPSVPDSRLSRKIQQLENLAKAVFKIAEPGDTIVDFCSGSGHLGILVAYCLPDCHVILLDNKEESLSRARIKVIDLELKNIHIVQCNLDYFVGNFRIGMSLHACGVASDLVIQTCLQRKAAFIVCPCCYGSLQDNHKINYPQSKCLQDSLVTKRDFFILGHCADQVHKQLYKKSEQGERCMAIVDFDRCLQAKEIGYSVSLAKLIPPSCTPRNNLLVGIPE